jgi:hypothetical protein
VINLIWQGGETIIKERSPNFPESTVKLKLFDLLTW